MRLKATAEFLHHTAYCGTLLGRLVPLSPRQFVESSAMVKALTRFDSLKDRPGRIWALTNCCHTCL